MGKGKTGGHWRPCNVGSVEAHNERLEDYLESVKKTGLNLYFFQQLTNNNSHWVSDHERYNGKTVAEVFDDMKKLYQQKTGQPPQLGEKTKKSKKTGREYKCAGWSPIREMCVPIKADTQIEDFDFLRKWAAKYGIEIMRIDLHKDEGYHNKETGEYKMNYHAHVVASFLDWDTGKTVKAGKEAMSEMQTILAIALGMQRGELKKDTGTEALTHQEYRAMMEELDRAKKGLGNIYEEIDRAKKTLRDIYEEQKKAETKLKGLTTMLQNLEEQKEAIEIDIAALEEERDNGNEEAAKKIAELTERLNQLNAKILERNEQISNAKEQLRELAIKRHDLQNGYDDLMRRKNKVADQLKQMGMDLDNADRELKRKREEIEKTDKSGEISRQRKYVDEREKIIFRRWPAAEAATRAIIERGTSRTARQFSSQQAIQVEQAIRTSGTTRQEAAADLCNLCQREFEDKRTWPDWVEKAFDEVMSIANNVDPLSAFLQDQGIGSGGGPSHITDLTGWDGKRRR